MLRQAQRRLPQLKLLQGDAAQLDLLQRYDAIFSSMMLHWLPEPWMALRRWQSWLAPGGQVYVALLGPESFREWRQLCAYHGIDNGLWSMPTLNNELGATPEVRREILVISYGSATEFLHQLKKTGAATPRAGYKKITAARLRQVLRAAPKPFAVSYQVVHLTLPAHGQ